MFMWVHARLCKLQKRCTWLAATSDKVYQLLAHGRWFSRGTPGSSTTKTGRHDIAEILLKVMLKHQKSNQIIKCSCTIHVHNTVIVSISRYFTQEDITIFPTGKALPTITNRMCEGTKSLNILGVISKSSQVYIIWYNVDF